ncbi:DUF5996 family protein [Actinopolyspora saharensis]|uniref:DUF5996 family protein n=1 Tax=Actinopolyspora saharensis TaxID=995062 RepID=UPI003F66201F
MTTESVLRVEQWPALRVSDWVDTRDTLHMWLQLVGKIKLALNPMINHWWQIPLYVSARGLTTGAMDHSGRTLDMEFDFTDHRLVIRSSSGEQRAVKLEPKTVAEFHRETMRQLDQLGLPVAIRTKPTEVTRAIPFEQDEEHGCYESEHARLFWGQLRCAQRVFEQFRSGFIGKVSPVHLFWGAMDLAVTRFSGRTAPRHPGGAPNCGDWVMVEGYSHELSSCGFWPGGGPEGAFYSYAYPQPAGFAEYPVLPEEAHFDNGEFLLPYDSVRRARDPEAVLLGFLRATYEAAAECGDWDRAALEDDPARRAGPR